LIGWLNNSSGSVTQIILCVVHIEIIVEKLALEQDFLQALWLSPENYCP
jgi:hypothetical protein